MEPWQQAIEHLEDPMVREFAQRGRVRSFARNAVIINEGDRGDSMYVILAGEVEVFVSDARGREMVLDDLGPGEYFGEMALDGAPRSASVRALGPVTCSVIDAESLRATLQQPELALRFIIALIERARAATESVKNLALSDVYTRVREKLIAWSVENGDGTRTVPERMTQKQIAKRVGAQRDMVSRICAELIKGTYLQVVDKQYTLLRSLPERF